MKRLLLLTLLCAAPAAADEGVRTIPADAAIVVTARPLSILGVASRIGSGWDKLVRRQLPIPPAVSPFDPTLLSTLGIDPAATTWASLRALRGHVHVRLALPLSDKRLDEAVVRSASSLLRVPLEHKPGGAWIGHDERGAYVVRLDGTLLVADALLRGNGPLPSPVELQRLVPLHPPRAFDPVTHGAARRMGPSDAIAAWIDLTAAAPLGLIDGERKIAEALKSVSPEMRTKIEHAGKAEIATCRAAIKNVPATFDDLFLAVVVRGPDSVQLEAALGGRRAALATLRPAKAVRGTRTLLPADVDTELRVALSSGGPLAALTKPLPGKARELAPRECPGPSAAALSLRAWPTMWGRTLGDAGDKSVTAFMRLLGGVRGATLWIPPGTTASGGNAFEGPRGPEVVALVETEDAVRGDLDRMMVGSYGAATPLRAGGRQITAYALPSFPWSTRESPIVTVDPLDGPGGGAVVGFGGRDRLKVAYEKLVPAPPPEREAPPLLKASASSKLISRMVRGDDALIDGIGGLEGAVVLDEDLLRVDVDVALRPAQAR